MKQHLHKDEGNRPERILVVDPDAITRNITVQALKYNGFNPDEVRNGRIALSKLRQDNYDLVITVYQMPIVDGHQLALQIRENRNTQTMPIIMIGQRENFAELVKAQSVGIQAFIAAPFSADRLTAEVERILANLRIEREHEEMKHYLTDETIAKVRSAGQGKKNVIEVENAFRTVVFTDIAKFTPLCENLNAHEVVDMLNTYFDEMVEILIQYGATIDKFIGDAIMALFDKEEDGAHRAVAAGMQMVGGLDAVREVLGLDIHMRVGINSGHVILGDIGSRFYRRDFTVIGDNVNTAQRLESNSEIDGVLISKSTYNLLGDLVTADQRQLTLKGKKDTFEGYQVREILPYAP